jgi:hypothetical protein
MLPAFAAEFTIRWTPNIEASGLNEFQEQSLSKTNWTLPEWQRLFSVYAAQGNILTDLNMPAVTGKYFVQKGALVFKPQFALQPNINYRAIFRPENLPGGSGAPITSQHRIAADLGPATTVVSAIHPSVDQIPENVLKFYLQFSAPMSGGHIYDFIQLLDADGKAVELPFLEIDEELWDPAMTRLTLFLDPGRIKRGVRPLVEIGPSLRVGKNYTLRISREWKDANGKPLQSDFEKKFRVTEADREPPDPTRWKIVTPKAGSKEPLQVQFDEPMDHALAQRILRVFNSSAIEMNGAVELTEHDVNWKFRPEKVWEPGQYQIRVPTIIEDLAGNNIGKPFDVDPAQKTAPISSQVVQLPFTVH